MSMIAKALPLGCLLLGAAALHAPVQAQVPGPAAPFQSYAAKFVCGPLKVDDDVVRGVYATDINIHNPAAKAPVRFFKKAVDAVSGTGKVPIQFFADSLAADHVEQITCAEIYKMLGAAATPNSHVEGFVVIEVVGLAGTTAVRTYLPLDVVGKYTARQFDTDVQSLSIVQYAPKLITQ